jgi:response regulator RpfG family c-di-GMP phosphodiesterase
VPVIFITARHETEAVMEGFQVGGADYITKPFNKDEVLTRIRFHLENSFLHRALRERNLELEKVNAELTLRKQELEDALANVKTLRGLVPICAYCKKIRDDKGFWDRVETYVEKRSEASFSHGICPDCVKRHFPQYIKTKQEGA